MQHYYVVMQVNITLHVSIIMLQIHISCMLINKSHVNITVLYGDRSYEKSTRLGFRSQAGDFFFI